MNSIPRWHLLSVILLCSMLACTKIETTTIGTGLLPAVDNINTFDTLIDVISNNYIPEDSTRLLPSDAHVVGNISNDPYFGTTVANMFFETKPNVSKFQFALKDSIKGFDSAVMVLRYTGYYGDSNVPANFRLYEVDRPMQFDTSVVPTYTLQPNLGFNRSKLWGQKIIAANQFKDSIAIRRGDSVYRKVANELRIPIDQELAKQLFFQDTLGAYLNDSAFKRYLPGFALEVGGGNNTLFYFSINAGTRLEFYYRTAVVGRIDTTVTSFVVHSFCGHASAVKRNYAGAEINNFLANDPVRGASQLYVQTSPGTMVSVAIPALKTLSNRIIHRAELRVSQLGVPSGASSFLFAPQALYLDVAEPNNVFRGVPYDLSPLAPYYCSPSRGIDFGYFGGFTKYESIDNERVAVYRFNLARHIQNIVSKGEPVLNFRLSAPFTYYYKNCSSGNPNYDPEVFQFSSGTGAINRPADGRVRLAGGSHPNPRIKMQMRIIYSRL